jgi:hypothetical protein
MIMSLKWRIDSLLNVVVGCIMSMQQVVIECSFADCHCCNSSHNAHSYAHAIHPIIPFAMLSANLLGHLGQV